MDFASTIYTASTWIVPILIAITFHEAAHAYAAWKLGDDTAHRLGRVTFNPLKHVDPVRNDPASCPALPDQGTLPVWVGEARPGGIRAVRPSAPGYGPCCNGRASDEFSARLYVGGPPSDCPAAARDDCALVGSDPLSVYPAEPDIGDLQHVANTTPGWRSGRHEYSARCAGKAIRQVGALWLPDTPGDCLPSADAWETSSEPT